MSIIGDGIMLGAGGESASIFVTGLSETDTVTATNGRKTKTGVWTQKPNPAYVALPDGYTQLEYVQSSGTEYIDTGIIGKSGIEVETKLMWLSAMGDQSAIGARNGSIRIYPVDLDSGKWSLGYSGNNVSSVAPVQNQIYDVYSKLYAGSQILKVDGTTILNLSISSSYNTNLNLWMPSTNYDGGYAQNSSVRIYFMQIKMDGVLVRNFIPCKRISDGSIGMYDLVSETFFANSGTGTFTAGEEIPQYITGFEIAPIKSYGTWTVTATDGTKTATETLLVDSAIQYDIEMSYLLWLYKAGNEYESVTGGFVFANDSSNVTGTKNSDNFQVSASYDGKRGLFRTSNKIELNGYTKMSVEVEVTGVYKTYTSRFFGVATGTSVGDDVLDGATDFYNYRTGEQTTGSTIPKTVLSITLNQTIAQYVYAGISQGTGRIYNIWLE